eukprot:scaffold12156_cov36-Phaeocystis_antarctica.AAC.1
MSFWAFGANSATHRHATCAPPLGGLGRYQALRISPQPVGMCPHHGPTAHIPNAGGGPRSQHGPRPLPRSLSPSAKRCRTRWDARGCAVLRHRELGGALPEAAGRVRARQAGGRAALQPGEEGGSRRCEAAHRGDQRHGDALRAGL